jgi:tRNA A-37 threonylcarbamoyl transferase component Bud32
MPGEKRPRYEDDVPIMRPKCPLESFTIGLGHAPNSEAEIDACVVAASKMTRGRKLGCGEQGCTYSFVEDPTHVVKVTKLSTEAAKEQWRAEACIGRELGLLGVAPQIPKIFECNEHGYIVMDTLRDAKKLPDGTVIREKRDDYKVDHMTRMPANIQLGFVQVLATMIDNGFVHMDNHIENLGFIGPRPVVFDFGFTQRRTFANENEKLWALSFSLFQMLEHCPEAELECGQLWTVATGILQNGVRWNDWASARGMSLAEVRRMFPGGIALQAFKDYAAEISIENSDCIVGSLCYAMVIQVDLPARYRVSPYYGVIYKVRTNKYF